MTNKTLKQKTTGLVVAIAFLSMAAPAKSEDRSHSPIEGSWIDSNTRINQGFSFTAVVSFGAGGVLLATGSVAGPPLLRGGWAVALIRTVQFFQTTGEDQLVGAGTYYACDLNSENCKEDPSVRIRINGPRVVSERQREF